MPLETIVVMFTLQRWLSAHPLRMRNGEGYYICTSGMLTQICSRLAAKELLKALLAGSVKGVEGQYHTLTLPPSIKITGEYKRNVALISCSSTEVLGSVQSDGLGEVGPDLNSILWCI